MFRGENLEKSPPQDYGFNVSRGFPAGIDSRLAKPKIVTRAALKRRHVSFSEPGNDALRNATVTPSATSSDRHDQQRRAASASRFRQSRHRL
jgi:hypothetical protein